MKMLYVTSLSGKRINGFMRSAILAAKKLGIEFTMACNMDMADKEAYKKDCEEYGIDVVHVDFDRKPWSLKNQKAYKQLNQLMRERHFDMVHCNTPVGGVVGRLSAKKNNVSYVIYQAHGFHFWKGAPIKNWLLYFPIECLFAHYSDMIITINHEDYQMARRMKLKKNGIVSCVHGVGVDTSRFSIKKGGKAHSIRNSLGISSDAIVYISVGELNKNKNQKTLIRAFNKACIPNSYLLICGDGEKREDLEEVIRRENANNVCLLGFRSNIVEFLAESDVFVLPSYREGLSGALMEAMSMGLPCIVSKIRGNVDLVSEDYRYLFAPSDVEKLSELLISMQEEKEKCGLFCKKAIEPFELSKVVVELEMLYKQAIRIIVKNF